METNEEESKELEPESEEYDFTKPQYEFKPNEHHEWKQQGPYAICHSCELIHAQFIGMDKFLVGLDEQGRPLFKKKSELT